jgi:AcrR family transcriptional regulator
MSDVDSKTRILNTATRLFARQGYDGTSLQAIADAVGMRKQSLLHHFPSKKALRKAVIEELVARWRVRLPEILAAATSGVDRFDALINEGAEFFRSDPNRALLILRETIDRPEETRERAGMAVAPWFGLLVDTIKQGQRSGVVRQDVDPGAYLAECIILIIGTIAAADLAGAMLPDRDRAAQLDRQLKEIIRMTRTSLFVDTQP